MGTLADSFLADLEDLSDDAPEEEDQEQAEADGDDDQVGPVDTSACTLAHHAIWMVKMLD
jgi:hypothetical protein